ncbi:hypothetical protein VTK26DRAFT_963 [Humicola hyalothermophila]
MPRPVGLLWTWARASAAHAESTTAGRVPGVELAKSMQSSNDELVSRHNLEKNKRITVKERKPGSAGLCGNGTGPGCHILDPPRVISNPCSAFQCFPRTQLARPGANGLVQWSGHGQCFHRPGYRGSKPSWCRGMEGSDKVGCSTCPSMGPVTVHSTRVPDRKSATHPRLGAVLGTPVIS